MGRYTIGSGLGLLCIIIFLLYTTPFNHLSNYPITSQTSSSLDVLYGKHVGWIVCHGEDDNSTYGEILQDLVQAGAEFSIINNTLINDTVVDSFDILILEENGTTWQIAEINALKRWVAHGGGLYILGDEPGLSQENVSQSFGVYYNHTAPAFGSSILDALDHPILKGVTTIYSDFPTASIIKSSSNASLNVIVSSYDGQPMVATLLHGNGRVLWIVDADGIINDVNLNFADNAIFANNCWIWLATANPVVNPDGNPGDQDLITLIVILVISVTAIVILIPLTKWLKQKRKKKLSASRNI